MARNRVPTSIVTADDVTAVEQAMYRNDLDRLRALVGFLVEITVAPHGRGARTFDHRIVKITWRTA
jgi:hypothetical protein